MKTLFSFFLLAVAVFTVGCGYTQQSRFQMSFLPTGPPPVSPVADITPPSVAHGNPFLQQMPALLLADPLGPKRRTHGDALIQKADQAFNRGKKSYQSNDVANARVEFDSAIDLMLEASDENPADREEYYDHLDEMVEAIHRLDLAGLGASATLEQGKFEKAPLEDILQMTFPVDPRLKDRVREEVASSVSQLPLSVNDTVLGYINYFSNRGHGTIVAAIQRSGRYRPMIQRILDEEGVPQELIHLAQAESGFIPRAVSRAAAGGMWQFLVWRGQQYGLMQTRYTDERMDPEKATRAAAHHLRDLYSEFGDWYLAIAAYNCGPGVVERAVERTGYADFWELRSRGVLPAETTNYVPIILAMTIMEKNAGEYGLEGLQLDPPLEYDTVEISAPTSLSLVADITDMPLSELSALNPAVLRGIAPESYSLHVAKGTGNQLAAALQLIPAEHRDSWRMHRVGVGETLAATGKLFGTTPTTIMAANHLRSPEIMEGDRLLIPAIARAEAPARTAWRSRSVTVTHRTKGKTPPAKSTAVVNPRREAPVIVARSAPR
ncbi:MAG: transglycosylase SLT domain-containing protein [Acidobacteriia bacterium]|nr:transglycosylase SLT domain-containing protein [Terriglobia bacterium]